MLNAFHRAVAETLVAVDVPALAPSRRGDVTAFVDGQLRALPTHLALGVSAVAMLLSVGVAATQGRALPSLADERRRAIVARWARSPLPPVSLYVRLLRSLVVYAGHELLAETG